MMGTHGGGCGPLVVGLLAFLLALALAAPSSARVNRWKVVEPHHAKILRIAACESTSRWWIATGNGYYGGLQFAPSTWRSVGGRGLPHRHTKLEQMYRGALLIRREGFAPWPVCGRR